jgi:hypothetical protein
VTIPTTDPASFFIVGYDNVVIYCSTSHLPAPSALARCGEAIAMVRRAGKVGAYDLVVGKNAEGEIECRLAERIVEPRIVVVIDENAAQVH